MSNPRLKSGFGQVSNDVMRDPELTLKDKGLYAYLATYASSDNNDTYVSVSRMAEDCGVTVATIKRSIDILTKKGIINRVHRGKGESKRTYLLK